MAGVVSGLLARCGQQLLLTVFSVPRQELSEYNATAIKSPTNTVTVQGLKAGAIYVFQVRARTVAGYGRYSGKMYFQTMTEGKQCPEGRRRALTPPTEQTQGPPFLQSAFVQVRKGTPSRCQPLLPCWLATFVQTAQPHTEALYLWPGNIMNSSVCHRVRPLPVPGLLGAPP